ncbi:MAG: hypothetical protein K2O03_07430, partial [Lachnospiraceae bacterium]|nr:hypothetical protein [Lachnospiraceae bacterium]
MERILRSEEKTEILLLPVRHHSPACSLQIQRMIAAWEPTAVLVEGPDNANALLPVMVHEDTAAPFAIYYSYHDKAGKISEEKGHYKCYYPFLAYSPELVAVREAAARGIKVAFIDLSYGDILVASGEGRGLRREEEKNNYNDDYLLSRNEYIGRLCEKTGLRSFDEFWEKYFELNGLKEDCDTWFSHLLSYCRLARENTPQEVMQEDGCIAREEHMAARIVQWVQENRTVEKDAKGKEPLHQKILVVTGGFHTPALAEHLSKGQWEKTKRMAEKLAAGKAADKKHSKVPEKDQSVYLMPYSMEAADALNGYASGMPYTGFYQKVWEGLAAQENGGEPAKDGPYSKAVL